MLSPEVQQYLDGLLKPTYPTYGTLAEAVEAANMILLDHTRDEVNAALATYTNSLVKQIEDRLQELTK